MQTDGYNVYDDFESMEGITIYGCWTHARRKFVESLDEDNVKNTNKELQLCHDEIKTRRQKESYPIIREFEKWLEDTWNKALRTSRDSKAIQYTYTLLPRLARYVNDGRINILSKIPYAP